MNYHKIEYDNMLNGDGLRVVLYVAGCSHHCVECHNPQTWDPKSGMLFDNNALDIIMNYLSKDYIDGITFSGGDPLSCGNHAEVLKICKVIKSKFGNSKTIWLYTGDVYEDLLKDPKFDELRYFIDVLVDGEYDYKLKDNKYHWAGSTNQRVIDVKESLETNSIVLHNT